MENSNSMANEVQDNKGGDLNKFLIINIAAMILLLIISVGVICV